MKAKRITKKEIQAVLRSLDVTAIYNCGIYLFYSNYYGVIGIAVCTSITEDHEPIYKLTAGTEHTVGGSVNRSSIITAMKRYITKSENKYIVHTTLFEDSGEICNCQLDINIVDYSQNN